MGPAKQHEFDFDGLRRVRVGRALRSAQGLVRSAVPLSDTDKLTLACMDALAGQIASELKTIEPACRHGHISSRIATFVNTLHEVSPAFVDETARYLKDAIARYCKK